MAHDQVLPEEYRTRIERVATDLCYCADRLPREAMREGQSPDSEERATLHENEQAILAPLIDDGFELVGIGVARCVLRCPLSSSVSDYVVKLARFGDDLFSAGFVQNKRETLLWHRHGITGDWPLLPVADYHRRRFRWTVMPYGEPLTNRTEEEKREFLRRARAELAILPLNLQELRADNFVVIENEPYLADYGRPDGV